VPGVKTIAALVSIINGAWTVIAGYYWNKLLDVPTYSGPVGHNLIVEVVGIILLLDSLVCLLGTSRAFYASAIVSVIALALEVLGGAQVTTAGFIFSLVLALATLGLDVMAARKRTMIAEEDHPLNLPVFG
jgi:hypothetical protein